MLGCVNKQGALKSIRALRKWINSRLFRVFWDLETSPTYNLCNWPQHDQLDWFSLNATGSHQTTAICSLLYLFRLGRRFFNFTRSLRCDVYRQHSIASGKPRHVIDFGWMSGCPFLHFKGCQQNGSLTLNFKDWMTNAHFAKGAKNGYSKDCLESVWWK